MKGIILAAGRGSRMGVVTNDLPKCQIAVAGKTLLDWQLSSLKSAGISQVAVVTGYKSNYLQSPLYETFHNRRWNETNMLVSLMTADSWLSQFPCIISYADILYHPDIVRSLCNDSEHITITYDLMWESLWRLRFSNPLSDAETFKVDDRNYLVTIGQRTQCISEIQGQYMGLIKTTPDSWQVIKELILELTPKQLDRLDMTGMFAGLLERCCPIKAIAISGRWCEIDSSNDLFVYENMIRSHKAWTHDWRE